MVVVDIIMLAGSAILVVSFIFVVVVSVILVVAVGIIMAVASEVESFVDVSNSNSK